MEGVKVHRRRWGRSLGYITEVSDSEPEDEASSHKGASPALEWGQPEEIVPKRKRLKTKETAETNAYVPRHFGTGLTLVDLPVEIWLEIFEYVDLFDLLRLTRTCKIMRGTLMRHSIASIWKMAHKNFLDELPDCPPDMDEPSWASLAMDTFCTICGSRVQCKTFWELRCRACRQCLEDPETFTYTFREEWDFRFPPEKVLPLSIDIRYRKVCLTEDLENFKERAKTFGENQEAFNKSCQEKAITIKAKLMHAGACRDWDNRRRKKQREQAYKYRTQRLKLKRKAIERKLQEIGYAEDLVKFKKRFPGRFEAHACVAEGPADLSDKEWTRIRPTLVEALEEHEKKLSQLTHNKEIAKLASLPEFEGKRVSRSMLKAMRK